MIQRINLPEKELELYGVSVNMVVCKELSPDVAERLQPKLFGQMLNEPTSVCLLRPNGLGPGYIHRRAIELVQPIAIGRVQEKLCLQILRVQDHVQLLHVPVGECRPHVGPVLLVLVGPLRALAMGRAALQLLCRLSLRSLGVGVIFGVVVER